MKHVLKRLSGFIFYGIVIAILAWTVSLTWDVLANRVLPGQPEKAVAGLVMFDAGMLGWLITFIFKAKGITQRAIAIGLSGISLLGMGAMALADLFLSGQNLTEIPANLGTMVVWGVGIMTFVHVIGIWGFHISDPETTQEIQLQTQEDQIVDQAIKTTEQSLEAQSARLAEQISARMEAKALYRLGLLNAGGPVIEGTMRDAPPTGQPVTTTGSQPSPKKRKPRGLFDLFTRRQPETMPGNIKLNGPGPDGMETVREGDLSPDQWGKLLEFYDELQRAKGPGKVNGAGAATYAADTAEKPGFLAGSQESQGSQQESGK